MKKIKYTYDVVFNKYKGEYVVFKNNEEHFIAIGIFSSPIRKECTEYIRKIGKGENYGKIQSRG